MGNIWMDWDEMTLSNPVVRANLLGAAVIFSIMYALSSYLKYISEEYEKELVAKARAAAAKAQAQSAAAKKLKKAD